MAEINYVLSTVDLDVFGGPTSLDISTDFGKTGSRGTRVWVGNGAPEDTLTTQDIALYDLYINTNTVNEYYSWLYQYVPEVGSPTWVRTLKLNPSQHSLINLCDFEAGEGTIDIPILDITDDVTITASQFIVRYSIENSAGNPVASSFTYSITGTTTKYLSIVLKGIEYSGSAWSDLTGDHKVHVFVSYLS